MRRTQGPSQCRRGRPAFLPEVTDPVQRPTEEERAIRDNDALAGFRGVNRNIKLDPSEVKHRPDGCYTDEEIGILSLEAWRTRCRRLHDYIPDRHWDMEVHQLQT